MRVIIAGPRQFNSLKTVEAAVQLSGFSISEVVSGCARGIDTNAIEYAELHGLPCKRFPADANFQLDNEIGGHARNGEMAAYAEALIVIDLGTGGSTNMLQHAQFQAKRRTFPIFRYCPSQESL